MGKKEYTDELIVRLELVLQVARSVELIADWINHNWIKIL